MGTFGFFAFFAQTPFVLGKCVSSCAAGVVSTISTSSWASFEESLDGTAGDSGLLLAGIGFSGVALGLKKAVSGFSILVGVALAELFVLASFAMFVLMCESWEVFAAIFKS